MSIRHFNIALGVAALLAAGPVRSEVLNWSACASEAAESNPELRAARANLSAAEYAVRGAGSGFFPQVSADAAKTESSGSAVLTPGSSASAAITATQNIFAGFQDTARISQARGNRDIAAANLDATRARLSQDLKNAYAGLLYAQDNVELTAGIVKRLEENLRLVELRYEGGRENRGSFLLTRATLAQGRYEQVQARQALVTAQTQLARVLGRANPVDVTAQGLVPVVEPLAAPDFEMLARATPDYRLAQAQETVAGANVTLARSGFYPSLNASGAWSQEGSDFSHLDADRRIVGLTVTVPLFNGGRDYYASKSASESQVSARAGTENTERLLRARLRQSHAAYVEAAEKLKVDAAFVEAATTRAQIARAQYNNGLVSFNDWNLIENDLIQRQKTMLASQRDRVQAEAAWEQVQGQGVIP
jgi:outer membrane protein